MKYTVDYFIKKFSKIPEKKWCTRVYSRGDGIYCSYGHLGVNDLNRWDGTIESCAFESIYGSKVNLSDINDGKGEGKYYGDSPKERILVALENAKGAGLSPTGD